MMVLLSIAGGVSVVTENVFENRFGFVDELIRLGADIRVDGNHAVVNGGRSLTGAIVRCPTCGRGRRWRWLVWWPRVAPNCVTSTTSTEDTSASRRSCAPWGPMWSGWTAARAAASGPDFGTLGRPR